MRKGILDFKADERCDTCEWFNPYGEEDGAGECWRFPPIGQESTPGSSIPIDDKRTVITRPKAHVCGEYRRGEGQSSHKMRVLVIAAHPDDEVLGCGATMKKLTLEGHDVKVILLGKGISSRHEIGEQYTSEVRNLEKATARANNILGVKDIITLDFPDNKYDSVPLLDVVRGFENYVTEYNPDVIITHHGGDLNVDHKITLQSVLTASRPQGRKTSIYSMFIPSATDYSEQVFQPNVFVNVEDVFEYKLRALNEYHSEMREYPHSRSIEALEHVAKYWGNRVGLRYAEPFVLIRRFEL
jgi:LmbE family N-acetylglucosaminyl deacetylase